MANPGRGFLALSAVLVTGAGCLPLPPLPPEVVDAGSDAGVSTDARAPDEDASSEDGSDAPVSGDGAVDGDGASADAAAIVPTTPWVNVTSNLAEVPGGLPGACGGVSFVSPKPDEDLLIVGMGNRGLYASSSGGQLWAPFGVGPTSDAITSDPFSMLYDPTNVSVFWVTNIHTADEGVYKSTDNGATLKRLALAGGPDLLSIDFNDPARLTLVAGGHEMRNAVSLSKDGGLTWTDIGKNLPGGANRNCNNPLVIDARTFLVGCDDYDQGATGILRSDDTGETWKVVSASGGAGRPLRTKTGAILWSTSGSEQIGLVHSTDDGKTWSPLVAAGVLRPVSYPLELPDGRLAAIGAGSQFIVLSSDGGLTWQPGTSKLPFENLIGLAYSSFQKAFYIWRNPCTAPFKTGPEDVMSYAFE